MTLTESLQEPQVIDARQIDDIAGWIGSQCDGDRVLVVGTSSIDLPMALARKQSNVTWVEDDLALLELARAEHGRLPQSLRKRIALLHAPLDAGELGQTKFDLVVGNVATMLRRYGNVAAALWTALSPGGVVLVLDDIASDRAGCDGNGGYVEWLLQHLHVCFHAFSATEVAGRFTLLGKRRDEQREVAFADFLAAECDAVELRDWELRVVRGRAGHYAERLASVLESTRSETRRLQEQLQGAVAARQTYDLELRYLLQVKDELLTQQNKLRRELETTRHQCATEKRGLVTQRREAERELTQLRESLGMGGSAVDLRKGQVIAASVEGEAREHVVLRHSENEALFHLADSGPSKGDFAELQVPIEVPDADYVKISFWVQSPYVSDKHFGFMAYQILVDATLLLEEDCARWKRNTYVQIFTKNVPGQLQLRVRSVAISDCKSWNFGLAGRIRVADVQCMPVETVPERAVVSTSPWANVRLDVLDS